MLLVPRGPDVSVIGKGIYTYREVADLTGLPPRKIRRWFAEGRGVLTPEHGQHDGEDLLSFEDMVETLVVGQFRQGGLSLQTIRKARMLLRNETGWTHPFADERIKTDGFTVILEDQDDYGRRFMLDLLRMQLLISDVVRQFLKDLEYDPRSHLAMRWNVAPGVVVDPQVAYGTPTVEGTRVSAYVLAQSWQANGKDTARVARWFGVELQSVLDAVAFARPLLKAA